MDAEVLIWTLVFLGGTTVILIGLLVWAFKKDREKTRAADADGGAGSPS
jgi:hypothetical protein